jgi:hypothetical protein
MPEFTWTGDDFFGGVHSRIAANVGVAGTMLQGAMKANIETQGPPRSSPGESPHKDSGDLYASVEANGPVEQGDVIYSAVGSQLYYGIILELQMNRPWMVKALRENQDALAQTVLHGSGTTE